MAFAFGIQYGLDDIRRANEAITRELEQQLAITQRLANESRMITGRSAYSLGAGPEAATNKQQSERDQEVTFNRLLDRRLRNATGRFAGMPSSVSTGIARNVGDVAQLMQGGLSARNIHGAMEILGDAVSGTRAVGAVGMAARALLPMAALGATSGAIMASAYQLFAAPPKHLMDEIGKANKAFYSLQSQFKAAGEKLASAPVDTGAIRGYNFDQVDSAQGFYGRMELSAKLAKDVYEAASALAAADPKDAARFLNLPGQQSKSSIRYYIKQMLDQGTTLGLRLAANDMTKTLGEIKKREAAQAELFDRDPIMASKHQERLRAQKWEERQRAKDLRDWSRS
jgi:hypothetical protein